MISCEQTVDHGRGNRLKIIYTDRLSSVIRCEGALVEVGLNTLKSGTATRCVNIRKSPGYISFDKIKF